MARTISKLYYVELLAWRKPMKTYISRGKKRHSKRLYGLVYVWIWEMWKSTSARKSVSCLWYRLVRREYEKN